MKVAPLQVIGNPNHLRVLVLLRKNGAKRFQDIQNALELNPAQIDRSLKFLAEGLWILPRTIPSEGRRIFVEYRIGKKGEALLEAWDAFAAKLKQIRHLAGTKDVESLERLIRSIK